MLPTIREEHTIDNDPMAIPFYPFGKALVKNKTRRRTKSDYVYETLFYICMFALVLAVIYNDMYVYQPKSHKSIHTTITNLTIDELSRWIPQALASMVIGQAIAWAMLYFSGRLLDRFPSLVLTLDSATLVFFILFYYRFPVNVTVDSENRLGDFIIVSLPVVASFILLPTTQRVVAHLRATLGVMMADHLPIFGLRLWKMMMPSPSKIKTTREMYEAYQAPGWWFFMLRILAWTTFLRLTLLSWFFADRIIHLSNYDGFFDCYGTAALFITVLTMFAFELRIGLLMVIFLIRRNKSFSTNRLAR